MSPKSQKRMSERKRVLKISRNENKYFETSCMENEEQKRQIQLQREICEKDRRDISLELNAI